MLPVAPAILSSRVSCLVRDFLIGGGLGFPLAIRPTAPRAAPFIAPTQWNRFSVLKMTELQRARSHAPPSFYPPHACAERSLSSLYWRMKKTVFSLSYRYFLCIMEQTAGSSVGKVTHYATSTSTANDREGCWATVDTEQVYICSWPSCCQNTTRITITVTQQQTPLHS